MDPARCEREVAVNVMVLVSVIRKRATRATGRTNTEYLKGSQGTFTLGQFKVKWVRTRGPPANTPPCDDAQAGAQTGATQEEEREKAGHMERETTLSLAVL